MTHFQQRLVAATALVALTGAAHGALNERCNGTVYDDGQDITWMQDWGTRGPDTQNEQDTWAGGLTFGGGTNWDLPTVQQLEALHSQVGKVAASPLFDNVGSSYWTGTPFVNAQFPGQAWFYNPPSHTFNHDRASGPTELLAVAVHPGDLGGASGSGSCGAGGSSVAEVIAAVDAGIDDRVDDPLTSAKARGRLGKAQDKLDDALARFAGGDAVKGWGRVADAVKELLKAQDAEADVADMMTTLVDAAHAAAIAAIDAAAGGSDRELRKADRAVDKARIEVEAKGRPDRAIGHFAKALRHAGKAAATAPGGGEPA